MVASVGKPDAMGRSSGKIGGRRGALRKPPKGEPFVWLTRELLASAAWQSLSINARRLIDFLAIENMNHAGLENGNLKATYQQLQQFGLTLNCIAPAIAETEQAGLVDCHRGGMRVATTYTLTWLPDRTGSPATNRWRRYKKQKSALRSESNLPPQVRADGANLLSEVRADPTLRSESPSRFRRGTLSKSNGERRESPVERSAAKPVAIAEPRGARPRPG